MVGAFTQAGKEVDHWIVPIEARGAYVMPDP
jgi:hypothetical protein